MSAGTRNSTKRNTPENATQVASLLAEQWPDAYVELDYQNAFQLLVATILAAQSTDKMINTITPALFAQYPDPAALAAANPAHVEQLVLKSGFFRQKTKSIMKMAQYLLDHHGGQVPKTIDELVKVPGVGRKTANVVLGNALGVHAGVVVDTHVTRLSQRLGLTKETDPEGIEQDLMKLLPREQWTPFANRLIWHGRRICMAKNPDHDHCPLAPICPSAHLVELPSTRPQAKKRVLKLDKPAKQKATRAAAIAKATPKRKTTKAAKKR
jgi:endonuclease-3